MSRRQTHSSYSEDTVAITNAVTSGLQSYTQSFGTLRVSNLVMEYGGASELARAIAGTPGGKLPARGTDERKAYDAAARSVNRWLNWEAGTGKQARNPNNKATQAKLQSLMAKKQPPTSATVSMTGWLYYDSGDDARWRTIGKQQPIILTGSTLERFLTSMQAGDTHGAYGAIFDTYGASVLTMGAEDNPQVDITFE